MTATPRNADRKQVIAELRRQLQICGRYGPGDVGCGLSTGCGALTSVSMRRSKAVITARCPALVRATPPARRMKSAGATSPLLISVSTTESAIKERNSAAKSNAKPG